MQKASLCSQHRDGVKSYLIRDSSGMIHKFAKKYHMEKSQRKFLYHFPDKHVI